MSLHWVDIAIIAIIGLSILTGVFRGVVKETIALAIWALAIWLGYNYSSVLEPLFSAYIHEQGIRTAVSFVIILFATLLIGGIVNSIFGFILKKAGLSGTDRTLGMIFGFVRGVFIVALVMAATKMTSLPYEKYSKESRLYAQFDPLVQIVDGYLPDFIKQAKEMDKKQATIAEFELDTVLNS